MAFTCKGNRITQEFSYWLALPWWWEDPQRCPSSPGVYGTPAASPEERSPSADRTRLCCGQTATERRGRRASSPCCPEEQADVSGREGQRSCRQHWGFRFCRSCKLCLCCSFLFQSSIISPALSSRTELNTLKLVSKQEVMRTFSPRTPERTLLNSCIWPPTPSKRPRWTQRVRIYVPASQLTQKIPETGGRAFVTKPDRCRTRCGAGGGFGGGDFLPKRLSGSYSISLLS